MINDRLRIDIAPSVSVDFGSQMIDVISTLAADYGLHVYIHDDFTTRQVVLEVTANDHSKEVVLTDGQTVERLRMIARERDMSVRALLNAIAKDEK